MAEHAGIIWNDEGVFFGSQLVHKMYPAVLTMSNCVSIFPVYFIACELGLKLEPISTNFRQKLDLVGWSLSPPSLQRVLWMILQSDLRFSKALLEVEFQ